MALRCLMAAMSILWLASIELACCASLASRAWQSNGMDYLFPELQDGRLQSSKTPVGIALSGGGSRAYSAAM